MPKSFQLYAIVPPGLESLAAAELTDAGQVVEAVHGGVAWNAGWSGLMSAHLHSRIASRVLVRVARFRARALGELQRKTGQIDWDAWIPQARRDPAAPPLPVDVSCSRSRLYHEGAVRERVVRALGWDEAGDTMDDPWHLHVRVHRDTVTISLDATGEHLHRRGYRLLTGRAPLRETLAAAALLASGWRPELPLLDPFAGSGTIAIEGALIARRIPPALSRADREPPDFPFLKWEDAPIEAWRARIEAARSDLLDRAPAPIFASDRDSRALDALAKNAEAAGVDRDIEVTRAALTEAPLPGRRVEIPQGSPEPASEPDGWIVTNPPYGARLGERRKLRPLYRALGRQIAGPWERWGWCAWMSDPVLIAALRDELGRRGEPGDSLEPLVDTRNGGIAVTLMRRLPPESSSKRPPHPDPQDDR